jgi:ABC-2 type transport system permease protein
MSFVATLSCELKQTWRDGRARAAAAALLSLFAITLAVSWQQHERYNEEVRLASEMDRRIWEGQGERNPHSAAHFGQYAFKPAGALSSFDPGMTPWLGRAFWMEAHYQNTATFRAADDQAWPTLIATLSPAFVLQYLAPLLLIFVGYATIARERERQTLKLALANGASLVSWVFGRATALAVVALMLWIPALVLTLMVDPGEQRDRTIQLAVAYAIYLATLCALIIAVSAKARTPRGALLALLCGWIVMALVVPRVAALSAERIAPSIDAGQFWRDVRADLRKGSDGHSSEQELLRKTLAQYGVTREEDLPVSFAGIALQAGEEHGNQVFDQHYGRLQASEQQQRTILRAAAVISPWVALRPLSAGLAGTDAIHHWHFVRGAEQYRRELQRYLNGDMAQHAKDRDFDYRAGPEIWKHAPEFEYSTPSLQEIRAEYVPELSILFAWFVFAAAAAMLAARGLAREGALS